MNYHCLWITGHSPDRVALIFCDLWTGALWPLVGGPPVSSLPMRGSCLRTGGNQGIGFAVPGILAREVINSLRQNGRVVRGYIGVSVQTLTPELADAMKLKGQPAGALVGEVKTFNVQLAEMSAGAAEQGTETSPNENAGARKNDRLSRCGSEPTLPMTFARRLIYRRMFTVWRLPKSKRNRPRRKRGCTRATWSRK
jgi:hypothetical protein